MIKIINLLTAIVLLTLLMISYYVLFVGHTHAGDSPLKITNCEIEYHRCIYDCGEGWGSGLCKSECTNNRNKCKST